MHFVAILLVGYVVEVSSLSCITCRDCSFNFEPPLEECAEYENICLGFEKDGVITKRCGKRRECEELQKAPTDEDFSENIKDFMSKTISLGFLQSHGTSGSSVLYCCEKDGCGLESLSEPDQSTESDSTVHTTRYTTDSSTEESTLTTEENLTKGKHRGAKHLQTIEITEANIPTLSSAGSKINFTGYNSPNLRTEIPEFSNEHGRAAANDIGEDLSNHKNSTLAKLKKHMKQENENYDTTVLSITTEPESTSLQTVTVPNNSTVHSSEVKNRSNTFIIATFFLPLACFLVLL